MLRAFIFLSLSAIVCCFTPETLMAQEPQPLGGAFLVSEPEPDTNFSPSVASDSAGNFVVVWGGGLYQTYEYFTFGQRFSSDGQPLGSNFIVTEDAVRARIAMASDGHFVVAWRSNNDLVAQRFDPQASPIGQPETVADDARVEHDVVMQDNGDFLVVWVADDGDGDGLFGRRFPASAPPSAPFQVNAYTTGTQRVGTDHKMVGQDSQGRFVVAWFDGTYPNRIPIARLFHSDGSPSSPQFTVPTSVNQVAHQSVDMAADGQFVIAWSGYQSGDLSTYRIAAHRFDSLGSPSGSEFQVNTISTGLPYFPFLKIDSEGDFVVLWNGAWDPDTGLAIALGARRFSSDGTPQGDQFVARGNGFVAQDARLAHQPGGEFTVVFEGGPSYGLIGNIMAQRFEPSLFVDGFESGDTSAWSSSQP